MTATWCWIDGEVRDAATATVGVTDHGLTVGDGVFETMKVVDGTPFALTRHLRRLRRSAAAMALDLDAWMTDDALRAVCAELISTATARGAAVGRVRLTVTGGPGPAGSGRGDEGCTLLVVAGALAHLLRNTPLGWRICAVGASERAAAYAAVSVRRVRFMTYAIIGGLCGASAFLLAGRLSSISSTGSGANYELDAIAAVIIGGTPMTGGRASVWGTLAGVFILGIISNILDLWSISANLQGTVKGLVIIMAVLFQFQKRRG